MVILLAGNIEKAVHEWSKADNTRSNYNLGNALAHLNRYQQAIEAYDRVLKTDPNHEDALHNRELLRKMLKEQKKMLKEFFLKKNGMNSI